MNFDFICFEFFKPSWLGPKKPTLRSQKMISDIQNLGKQILTLADVLSMTFAPIIIQQLTDQILLNKILNFDQQIT